MKIIFSIIILLLGIVAADYQGWLGIKTKNEVDYFSIRFAAVDEVSNDKISDFFINCTRKGSRNACSIEQGSHKVSRKAKFAIVKQIKKTWLFTKDVSIVGENEVDVHLMFIHPNYDRLTKTYSMKQLLELQNNTITIRLKRSSE